MKKRKIARKLTAKPRVKTLPVAQLKHFHKLLLQRRSKVAGTAEQLEGKVFKNSMQEASGNLSTQPLHMADLGTDEFEEGLTLGLMENEEEELAQIDEALERIKDRSYGICENCSKPIPKGRLKVIPHARLCIKCKEKEEAKS